MATTRESPYVVKQGRPSKAKKIKIFFLIIKIECPFCMKAKDLILTEPSPPCGGMVGSGILGQQGRGLCWPDSEFLVSFRAGACDRGLCSQQRGPWPPCCSASGWSAASSTTTACWCRVRPGGSWQELVLMEDAIQTRDLGVWKSSWGQRGLLSHPPP